MWITATARCVVGRRAFCVRRDHGRWNCVTKLCVGRLWKHYTLLFGLWRRFCCRVEFPGGFPDVFVRSIASVYDIIIVNSDVRLSPAVIAVIWPKVPEIHRRILTKTIPRQKKKKRNERCENKNEKYVYPTILMECYTKLILSINMVFMKTSFVNIGQK